MGHQHRLLRLQRPEERQPVPHGVEREDCGVQGRLLQGHPVQARARQRHDVRLLLRDPARVLREAPDRRLPGGQDHDPRVAQGHGAALRRAAAGGALFRSPPGRLRRAELRRLLRRLPRRAGGSAVTERLWIRTALALFAGLLAAAAVVFYLGISQKELLASLHGVAEQPLLMAAAGGLVLMALQALRWWVVMRPLLDLSYGQAFRAMMVGFFFNVVLPARGGDLLRVQYLGKRTGVSRAKLLGTEIVDF